MRPRPLHLRLVAAMSVVLVGWPAWSSARPAPPSQGLAVHVLSNRADLVSGGDVLLQVDLPPGATRARVRVDGRDVSKALARRANGAYQGLVTGLRVGVSTITAEAGGRTARVSVTNHPNGGPVFSGPQVQPWTCQATAVDRQCNQPAAYAFEYVSTDGSLKPYDPESPPADVATTTTDQGVTVPFVLRTETGYQDRDQYKIAVLYDPERAWSAWAPQRQWNRKLVVTHGSGCGNHYMSGDAPSVTGFGGLDALGLGFAVLSTALDNAGKNCNVVTQAESLVMAKERLVERYGRLRYTIGTGCSGGSLTQQQVANAYPGVYQGILPQCSFPDAWSTATQVHDAHVLRRYLEDPTRWEPGVVWTPAEIAAVEDHPNHANAVEFDELFWTSFFDPSSNQYTTRGLPGGCYSVAGTAYDAETTPGGVRCTLADFMVNVLGQRAKPLWTAAERAARRGFASVPIDNVGVQYGLQALKAGRLTPAQFVDLNAKVGGQDVDGTPTATRTVADGPGLRNAYRSGAVNTASNLDQVAIVDVRGSDYGTFHDAHRSWAMRARLQREQGHVRNHVIWFDTTTQSDHSFSREALLALDRWLTAVEADRSATPLAAKVVRHRPKGLVDRCTSSGYPETSVPGQTCQVPAVQSLYGTPRTAAGESIATDTQKCALKPLDRQDHYPVLFTEAQWSALRAAFPRGVCDWSRPGAASTDTTPWLAYQDASRRLVPGGKALGAAPPRSGAGWTSPSFREWLQGAGSPSA